MMKKGKKSAKLAAPAPHKNTNYVPSQLFPKAVDFDQMWVKLRQAASTFIAGPGHLSRAEWKDRFSDVYSLCIAVPTPYGQRLYNELKDFFEQHVLGLSQMLLSVGEENVLAEYHKNWLTYSAGIKYMNQLFWYLNTYVVKRFRYCEIKVDFSHYGIDLNGKMLEIGQLAMKTWELEMVRRRQDLLIGLLLKEIERDRDGLVVNHAVLQGVIQSLVQLRQLKYRDKLKLYAELFEIPFFKSSVEFFAQESQKLRGTDDVSTFMAKVTRRLNDEEVRARRYLHESSHLRISIECQLWLLSAENVNYMNSNCRSLLQREQWNDLSNMYRLLCLLEDDQLNGMIDELEQYLTESGMVMIQSLDSGSSSEKSPKKYVDAMIHFYNSNRERIIATFTSKSKTFFEGALDKACSAIINHKPTPKSVCKSPELLSRYCDELLRNNAKGLTESETDDKLNQVILIFRYLDDKDVFERFYARSLAKRLIYRHSQSMEMEESMINRLRQIYGYEYSSKLHRMFTDVTLSADINSKFNDFIQASDDRQLSHNFNVTVIQAGVWPIPHNNSTTLYLPQELEKSVSLFEQFYNHQFTGRKINWLHNLSHVDVRFGYCKRPYLATIDMHTTCILLAFNTVDQNGLKELKDTTQLSDADLLKLLQLLVDAKILLTETPLTQASVLRLNLQYNNKRTKFKILASITAPTEDAVQTQSGIDTDRRILIQATIVRIMKARKELRHSTLMEEVIVQTSGKFTPKISLIKSCIDYLLDREYIARADYCTDNYIYIA